MAECLRLDRDCAFLRTTVRRLLGELQMHLFGTCIKTAHIGGGTEGASIAYVGGRWRADFGMFNAGSLAERAVPLRGGMHRSSQQPGYKYCGSFNMLQAEVGFGGARFIERERAPPGSHSSCWSHRRPGPRASLHRLRRAPSSQRPRCNVSSSRTCIAVSALVARFR